MDRQPRSSLELKENDPDMPALRSRFQTLMETCVRRLPGGSSYRIMTIADGFRVKFEVNARSSEERIRHFQELRREVQKAGIKFDACDEDCTMTVSLMDMPRNLFLASRLLRLRVFIWMSIAAIFILLAYFCSPLSKRAL